MKLSHKELVYKIFGGSGRMLSGSKSGYSNSHPNNLIVFNACIMIEVVPDFAIDDAEVPVLLTSDDPVERATG